MKICYFGIFNPEFGRNKIYIEALKAEGHEVIICRDDAPGLAKYIRLWSKHKEIKDSYDFMIVGYPGHIITPLAKILSKKPVIVDALGSLYDAEVYSHEPSLIRKIKSRIADILMVKFADRIMLETAAQKSYFENRFGRSRRFEVVYTGVSEAFGVSRAERSDRSKFIVHFRGKLTPESGIMHILEAAKLLKNNPNIRFRITGSGYLLKQAEQLISHQALTNVELITRFLSSEELVQSVADSDLMLGQFEDNPRLNRTIPHKAFEAFASGVPYLTADAPAIREAVEDGVSGYLVPLADSAALANKIEILAQEPGILKETALRARRQYDERFSPKALAKRIIEIMLQYRDGAN